MSRSEQVEMSALRLIREMERLAEEHGFSLSVDPKVMIVVY